MSTFACRLVDHINRYVELRRSLGYSFESQAATLTGVWPFCEAPVEGWAIDPAPCRSLLYLNAR